MRQVSSGAWNVGLEDSFILFYSERIFSIIDDMH